jgi:menaquinone-dependent protoporphyrinogen oxidase
MLSTRELPQKELHMIVLVTYATRHGATRGIAERLASRLVHRGLSVALHPVTEAGDPSTFDAVVIGSAAYAGSWLKEAGDFVRAHRAVLAHKPVWLFSSGPVGTDPVDAKGRDVRVAAEPKEFRGFRDALRPREMRVFFGAFDPDAPAIGAMERAGSWLFRKIPAAREALPAGDFRDWADIDGWADHIAGELLETRVESGVAL